MPGECAYVGCEEDGAVVRRCRTDGEERPYCHTHDPLEHPPSSDYFEEVSDA